MEETHDPQPLLPLGSSGWYPAHMANATSGPSPSRVVSRSDRNIRPHKPRGLHNRRLETDFPLKPGAPPRATSCLQSPAHARESPSVLFSICANICVVCEEKSPRRSGNSRFMLLIGPERPIRSELISPCGAPSSVGLTPLRSSAKMLCLSRSAWVRTQIDRPGRVISEDHKGKNPRRR